MEYTYYVQQQAERHIRMMTEKNDFEVCGEFLDGIDKAEFITAYQKLHGLIKQYMKDVQQHPETLGMPLYEIDKYRSLGREARESSYALLWFMNLLFAIGSAGKMHGDEWVVNGQGFADILAQREFKALESHVNYLIFHGFSVSHWDGKKFVKTEQSFSLKYADMNVFKVLSAGVKKAVAVEASADSEDLHLGVLPQYLYFESELFADTSDRIEPRSPESLCYVLDGQFEYSNFFNEMNSYLEKHGFLLKVDNDMLRCRYYDENGRDTSFFCSFTDYRYGKGGDSKLMYRFYLRRCDRYSDYINTLPSELKHSFTTAPCAHCKDECGNRITYEIDGKPFESCGCFSFQLWYLDMVYIGYYKKLFELEMKCRNDLRLKKKK